MEMTFYTSTERDERRFFVVVPDDARQFSHSYSEVPIKYKVSNRKERLQPCPASQRALAALAHLVRLCVGTEGRLVRVHDSRSGQNARLGCQSPELTVGLFWTHVTSPFDKITS